MCGKNVQWLNSIEMALHTHTPRPNFTSRRIASHRRPPIGFASSCTYVCTACNTAFLISLISLIFHVSFFHLLHYPTQQHTFVPQHNRAATNWTCLESILALSSASSLNFVEHLYISSHYLHLYTCTMSNLQHTSCLSLHHHNFVESHLPCAFHVFSR